MSSIMIIEDNVNNAQLAAKLLKLAGHEVIMAQDGETALRLAQTHQPDAVLADLGLPDIDGQVVISLLRQIPHMQMIPIIAFTSWPETTITQMAMAYGCNGVITKPISTRTFAHDVVVFIQQAEA